MSRYSIFILSLLSNLAISGTITIKEKRNSEIKNSKHVATRTLKKANKNIKLDQVSNHQSSIEIKSNNESISLDALRSNIVDFTTSYDVLTGSVIKGRILNSIVSSNLESPIVVEVTEQGFGIEKGTKLICGGITKNHRVVSVCDKLIGDSEEYAVNVSLLNLDGTSGLVGEVYSGKEKYMVGAIGTAFLRSALDVSQDRIPTITGEYIKSNAKNKILSGTIGSLDEGLQVLSEEMKTQEVKISIEAGKEVLIFFNQRFRI